ncbi:MAG TPA: molybdopterin-dependent oxidoreductase [Jiangellaceae bacterium]|nr:molybdopterin-dependent oxidoreductase [Jiangellaceae bacterium]
MIETSTLPTQDRTRRLLMPALAGIAAAALGLGVAELVAGLLGRTATPVLAVGEAFIDRVPTWLKDLAVDWFGTADKAVLIGGVLLVFGALSAGIGVLASRNRSAGLFGAAALGAIAALAVWSRPDSTTGDLLPTIVGAGVSLIALDRLTARAPAVEVGTDDADGRRTFMRIVGLVAGLGLVAFFAGRWLGGRRSAVEESREAVALPDQPVVQPPGVDLGVDDAEPWQTPNEVFYRIDTALAVPLVRAETWGLRVHGMVEREVSLTFDDLVAIGLVERWVTLTCVSNEVGGDLAGNALWAGVPVADVLAIAGPAADADAVKSTSADGWTAGTPLDVLTDGRDALFAVAMNGEPLPVEHGFPVRMVVPGLYGYVSATKWVVDVEVTRFADFKAYWSTRGWSERAPIKTASRIDVPRSGASVNAGRVAVAGVAWAQHRGIQAVEVRVDDGPWQRAQLAEVPSTDTWRQWVWEWEADPGDHDLHVRATSADGELQTEEEAPPAPDGATGWHRVNVNVDA